VQNERELPVSPDCDAKDTEEPLISSPGAIELIGGEEIANGECMANDSMTCPHPHGIAAVPQEAKTEQNGNDMNQRITLDQPNGVEGTILQKTRNRRPLPAPETRDWMTANETALALGCSVATLHRLRRGLIPGIEPLPCSRYGRKSIFRKASVTRWQDNHEKRGRE
jgi:hypothetical protein